MKTLIKLSIGLLLIGFMLTQLSFKELGNTLAAVDVPTFAIAAVFFLGAALFEVLRLYVLLRSYCSLFETFKLVFIGLFFNNFLPTNIGGDVYKAITLKNHQVEIERAITYILFDRIIGMLILLVTGLVYLFFSTDKLIHLLSLVTLPGDTSIFLFAFLGLLLLGTLVFLLRDRLRNLYISLRAKFQKIGLVASEFNTQTLVAQSLLAFFYHALRLFAIYFVILSLNEQLAWHGLIFVLTTVAIVSALPISIGGLGVREGALASGLVFLGITKNIAISVALINLLYLWIKAFIGAQVFLLTRQRFIPESKDES